MLLVSLCLALLVLTRVYAWTWVEKHSTKDPRGTPGSWCSLAFSGTLTFLARPFRTGTSSPDFKGAWGSRDCWGCPWWAVACPSQAETASEHTALFVSSLSGSLLVVSDSHYYILAEGEYGSYLLLCLNSLLSLCCFPSGFACWLCFALFFYFSFPTLFWNNFVVFMKCSEMDRSPIGCFAPQVFHCISYKYKQKMSSDYNYILYSIYFDLKRFKMLNKPEV